MLDPKSIGILGGSFNPPHEGHKALVQHAMKRLQIARTRVLVSPQNPLKDPAGYAPLQDRIDQTKALFADMPNVLVQAEAEEAPTYAANTLRRLIQRERTKRFVYIMGADSFANLHHWYRWREIMQMVPIAVISRPANRLAPLNAPAARTFWQQRVPGHRSAFLAKSSAPAWCFIDGLNRPESSTAIREARVLEPA